ncbi:hypothetical protein DFH07DRAFT_1002167 [Mycena maculata]|uniref:Minichromosome loss protein Mcl1 middle region domain-containing protein n=1 Tax=Mycena maculata TaxID=230809 RepID=A0AAD7HRN0_9AGAR|nr:hypothetical protein DFH07DRAFT_1002167 [Mycena maculata]
MAEKPTELIKNRAHGSGYTCLAFSRDGLHAFTGGDDCIVRLWNVSEGSEQEPATVIDADRGITSISPSEDCWLSSSLDGEVKCYEKATRKYEGSVTSLNVPVRCVAIDPRGKTVAVASDELTIRLVDMDDRLNVKLLTGGHRSEVRKATWHPTESFLTTCGSDGQIVVWDVSKEESHKETSIPGIIPTVKEKDKDKDNEAFFHDCSAIWHPSGDYFFVVSRARSEIITIRRSDWKKDQTFFNHNVPGALTALALSPNGAYLASASQSGVFIWSTQTRKIIAQNSSGTEAIITQLAFCPTENLLAWTSADGAFIRWPKPIPDGFADPVQPLPTGAAVEDADVLPPPMYDDDDDDVEINGIDGEDEALNDGQDDAEPDWMEEDDANTKTGPNFVKEMVSITKAQPPFQPGATPMTQTKRYLAFNRIGKIEVTAVPDSTRYLVDVKFWDESKRGGFHLGEDFEYNLGDLGERGALFACKPHDGEPAHVYYKLYGSAAPTGEWKYQLSGRCTVLGIAAGGLPPSGSTRRSYDGDLDGFGNVVIATDEGDLTFLSGTGRERRIMGLGGDFVSMVAGPEWVFVVHRTGSTTIDGSQNLSYTLINFDDFSVRQRDFLPIPKGHILTWIGITEEGAPAMYDTTGRVHVLTKYRIPHHASWARLMDTNLLERKKGKDESYWPIGLNCNTLMCVILKGTQTYPQYHPGLFHEDLPIEMPFRSDNKSEEKIERDTLLLEILRDALDDQITNEQISKNEQLLDKDLVLLIQSACQKDDIPRAIELAKLIHNARFLDSVIKISQFYHFKGLTEKIQMLKKILEEGEDRLIVAREKRKQWTKPDPLPRALSTATDSISSRPKPFQDFGPPPVVSRPGLAPAIPARETTRYTANPNIDLPSTPAEPSSASPPENKRKRDEVEDISASLDFVAPPPKQKTNPFARKVGQENGRNPFARKPELNDKTIQKSESFFDKVDAADEVPPKSKRPSASKPKDREKKDGPRQTTLFGMMASASNDKRSRVEKKSLEVVLDSQPPDSDITMTDSTLIETQPNLPEEWEETQPLEEVETQPASP